MPESIETNDYNFEEEFLTAQEKADYEEEKTLQDTIEQLRGVSGISYFIHRITPGKRSGTFIDSFPVADITVNELFIKLRDTYYGGDFRVEIRNDKGHLKTHKNISVEEKPRPKEEDKKPVNDNHTLELIYQTRNDMATMLQQMNQSHNDQLLKIMELQNQRKPGIFDDPTTLVTLVGLAKDFLMPKDNTKNIIEMLRLGKEMADTGSDQNILQTALHTLGPSFTKMTDSLAKQKPQPDIPVTPQPLPQPQPPEQPEPTPMDQNTQLFNQLVNQLSPGITLLINAAKKNIDPESYAEVVLDFIGDDYAQQFIVNVDYYNKLFEVFPAIVEYRQWFDDLREIIIEFLSPPPDSTVSDVSKNGGVSPTGTANTTHSGDGKGTDATAHRQSVSKKAKPTSKSKKPHPPKPE